MIKTHPKSKIYRIRESELKELKGVIIQAEHIAESIHSNYYCLVEVVSNEDYETSLTPTESNLDTSKFAPRPILDNLARAVVDYFNTKSTKEKAAAKQEAYDLANEWLTFGTKVHKIKISED